MDNEQEVLNRPQTDIILQMMKNKISVLQRNNCLQNAKA